MHKVIDGMIHRIKKNRVIVLLYEAPYKTVFFFLAKIIYFKERKRITASDLYKIESVRDIHKGERCFIVGCGPSLTMDDLVKLKDEICFTVNSGYRSFCNVGLCPNYYVIMDDCKDATVQLEEVLASNGGAIKAFTSLSRYAENNRLVRFPNDSSYIFRLDSILNTLFPRFFVAGRFSKDMKRGLYGGKTVICSCMQIAAYMGFTEIYLVGVDLDYSGPTMYSDIIEDDNKYLIGKDLERVSNNMRKQMDYVARDARKKGVNIYNASRGGKLESFPRVCLDDILCNECNE